MSLLHHPSRQGFVSSNLEFSWPPYIQLGADSFYCLLIPSGKLRHGASSSHMPTWLLSAHPHPGPQLPPLPPDRGAQGPL